MDRNPAETPMAEIDFSPYAGGHGEVIGSGPLVVVDTTGCILLLEDGRLPVIDAATIEELRSDGGSDGFVHLVATVAGEPVWAVAAPGPGEPPNRLSQLIDGASGSFVGLRGAHGRLDDKAWALAGRSVQIIGWSADHRFCGRCATPTEHHRSDRSMVCPRCGLAAFPRLSPAVIVLVERADGRALLAWGRQFPTRLFSTIAGFVEPGEGLEQAVAREVKEEVGVEVDDIRYFGSQPWPFPNSLMVGFRARYAGGEIRLQESEIREADWFAHDRLPPVPRGRLSIAGWLIDDWVHRNR